MFIFRICQKRNRACGGFLNFRRRAGFGLRVAFDGAAEKRGELLSGNFHGGENSLAKGGFVPLSALKS